MNREANPIPQGNYVPANRFENLIFTAGMTPRVNGVLMQAGAVSADVPLEEYRDAVRQAAKNALTAARNKLAVGERIAQILSITVYVNTGSGEFTTHSKLADMASGYFCEELGEAGIGCRAAIGVASLPGNAPVEISIIAAVEKET